MGKEIEMKLLTTQAGCHRLFTSRTVTKTALLATKKRLTLNNTYYDTKDGALSRERMAYRVRVTDGRAYEATIKTKGTSTGGLSVRGEFTVSLKDERPVTEGFPPDVTRHLKDLLHGESLVPTVTITFLRHAMDLAVGKSRVELSLDEGIIESGSHSQPLREVELELKEGDPAALFVLVSQLAGELPLYPEDRSKLERGLSLLAGKEPLEPCGDAVKVSETFAGAAPFLRETLHDLGVFFNGTGKGAFIADRLVLAADFWKEKAMGGDEALRLREAADHFGTDDDVYLEKDLEEGRTAALLWQCLAKVCSKSHEEESRFQEELPRVKK